MKPKVALGLAAVVALAGITAYALWDPSLTAPPTPVDRSTADSDPTNPTLAEAKGDPAVAVNRTEIVDSAGDPADSVATGVDIRVIWDDDEAPATGMQVFLTEYSHWTSAPQPDHTATTGDDGVAQFRGVAEGRYLVEGRFRMVQATPQTVEVTATSLEDDPFEIRIRRGTTVTGRVVDPDGRGIAGASVLRAGWASSWTQEIAVTEADGTFAIDGLHGRISMGARASGFVPSLLRGMNLNEKKSDTLVIVLQPAAAELTVVVVDPTGVPVEGARAAVGIFGRQNQPRRGADGKDEYTMPTLTKTDAHGIARLGGLAPGKWSLQVKAEGFSSHTDEVEVFPVHAGGQATPIERQVRLPELIVIEGHVRDGHGLPIEKVYVGYGRHGHLTSGSASTRADGSYRLSGAPAGSVRMRAQRKGLDRRETIETLPGRTHRWDVEFAAERKVHGSITWEDGTAASGASFSAWSIGSKPSWHTFDNTDEKGLFVLEMPEHVKSVRVQVRTAGTFYQVVHEGPLPEGNLDLVLGAAHRPSATIRGRIMSPDGKALGGADLWHALVGQGNSSPIEVDAEGHFEKKVTPGTYNLRIEMAGLARKREVVEVGLDEEKDLGEITLGHPAALRVTVDGAPVDELTFWLTHQESKRRNRLEVSNGEGSLGGLPAGMYRLQVCGPHLASESREIYLKAAPGGGAPTEVRLQARAARPLEITLTRAAGAQAGSRRVADLEILDAVGRVVVSHRASLSAEGAVYTKFALAPGRYELRAREGELSGQTMVEVGAASTEPQQLALELRPGG